MAAADLRQYLRNVFAVKRRQDTGVLDIRSRDERALLYFRRGVIVHVEQTRLGRTLGAYLIDQGHLTREQYATLAEKIARMRPETPMIAFMEHAIAGGFIEPALAAAVVGSQMERNFVRCFGWEIESTTFTASTNVLEGKPINPCSPEELAYLGLRRHATRDELAEIFKPYRDRCPRIAGSLDDLAGEFRLQPFEARFVRQLDQDTSLGELLEGPKAVDDARLALLVALYLSRRLRLVSQSGHRTAAVDESGDIAMKQKLSLDHVRLSLPRPPSEQEVEAAGAFLRGKRLAHIDPSAAAPHLERAVELHPRPDYGLYKAWVEHTLAGGAAGATLGRALEDATQAALTHDSTNAFAYCVVGQLHLSVDDERSALLAFRRARKLDPAMGAMIREIQRRHSRG